MKNKSLFLFIGIIILFIQSCNFPKIELRNIEFKPEMQQVADKYKKLLEPEIFQTSSGWYKFDTTTTHKIIVTVYNSDKLPEDFNEKEELAIKIASDVYSQVINKDDFSIIEVVFLNKSGVVVSFKTQNNFSFSYEDIEKYIKDNNKET